MLTRAMGALAMPLLLRLPPEAAHRATIAALKHAPFMPKAPTSPRLVVNALGLKAAPGQAIDSDRIYGVSSNMLGSSYGSTGPASTNPATAEPSRSAWARSNSGLSCVLPMMRV